MPRGSLEVIEYVPRPAVADPPPVCPSESEDLWSSLRLEHRTLTSCAAALAAVALHLLFVAPMLWGGGSSGHARDNVYRGDTAAMQWVVLEESAGSSRTVGRPKASAPTLITISVTEPLSTLPSIPSPAPAADSRAAQSDGQSGLGAMYGRYLGQIHARIDRAWERPRTAIGAPIFQCQVQVDQDRSGRVQQVTLLECNGGSVWEVSLVHAIERASPLPAPPAPGVFVHHVLLAFRAAAYSAGAPAQLYQPPSAAPVNDEASEGGELSQSAFQALRQAAQARKPGAVELRIEGSKVEVEPDRQ